TKFRIINLYVHLQRSAPAPAYLRDRQCDREVDRGVGGTGVQRPGPGYAGRPQHLDHRRVALHERRVPVSDVGVVARPDQDDPPTLTDQARGEGVRHRAVAADDVVPEGASGTQPGQFRREEPPPGLDQCVHGDGRSGEPGDLQQRREAPTAVDRRRAEYEELDIVVEQVEHAVREVGLGGEVFTQAEVTETERAGPDEYRGQPGDKRADADGTPAAHRRHISPPSPATKGK